MEQPAHGGEFLLGLDDPAPNVGTAVTLAARIMSEAIGGEVLVSDVIRQLAAGKGFSFEDLGARRLRGFDEPVRLWAVAPRREDVGQAR